jgi:protein TonB
LTLPPFVVSENRGADFWRPRPVSMLPSDISFKADPAERLAPPRTPAPAGRPGLYLAPLSVGVVYAILLSLLLFENRLDPSVAPKTITMPIEIVTEPPPQEAADNPPPDSPSDFEKPATDAPRTATSAEPEVKPPDDASAAPPPPVNPSESDRKAGQAAGPPQQGEPQPEDKAPAPAPNRPAEVTRPAAELDREKAEQQQARANAETQTEKPGDSALNSFTMVEPTPEFDFGSLFRQSPVGGGTADSTYLSILYGLIVPRLHAPAAARGHLPRLEGMLEFSVDRKGNLVQRRIARRSGSPDLDAAALHAVVEASPFPPPPKDAPLHFTFTYVAD